MTTALAPRPDAGTTHGARVRLEGVTRTFGRGRDARPALAVLDVDVAPGELVVLVGPSGCGKSTALNLVAGFLEPTRGRVLVDDVPVRGPGVDRGVVFQQPRLFPWLTVRDNVALGPRLAGAGRRERTELAQATLELVGLPDAGDRRPWELSGGMQQRAAIARALVGRPRVLLMDEPFAALDALTRERLQEELLHLWATTGTTVLFVTHSVDEAAFLGTRALVFSASPGRVVVDHRLRDVPAPGADDARDRDRDDPATAAHREVLRTAVRGSAA
ncbi:ABC transporter ATP-binding protein [Cellulomonas sp. Sa3CUA2]|uniref:ABC transporter ATP-binding protein n=1 Tax=Cellulomonas avistercoris TaxID=2762242 RepID=A0ABR8QE41_9CELL|nr:ABC transporter ATP-binding protein [Cellulomonas avistercoris]MBD7918686.1 ABC transporter ATP-binding protein [Cellulomonas avistercoris]